MKNTQTKKPEVPKVPSGPINLHKQIAMTGKLPASTSKKTK